MSGYVQQESEYRPSLDPRRLRKAFLRRTVDYSSGLILHQQIRQQFHSVSRQSRVPYVQPDIEFIVNLLPPTATPDQPINSTTTRFVHTSMNKHKTYVNVVRWTPEGRRVITGSASGEFTLWNGMMFNFETILQAHESSIRSMKWSRTGSFLLSGDNSGLVKYWQVNMNNLKSIQVHKDAVRGIAFSPSDAKFSTCSDDKSVKIWSFHRGACESTMLGHGWDVKCLDWHPYKGMIASGSKDTCIKLWDPRAGKQLTTLHGHKSTIHALQWNRNGNWLLSGSRDQTVKLFDIRVMREVANFRGHAKEVCSVAWHPTHELLFASGGSEGSLLWWTADRQDGPIASVNSAHDANIWALDWHPLGHILATGSNDYATRFWTRCRPGEGEFSPREIVSPTNAALEGISTTDERMIMSKNDSSITSGQTGGFYIPGFGTIGLLQEESTKSDRPSSSNDDESSRNATPDGLQQSWRGSSGHSAMPSFNGASSGGSTTMGGNTGASEGGHRPDGRPMSERDIEREEMRKRRKEMFDDFFGPRRRGGGARSHLPAVPLPHLNQSSTGPASSSGNSQPSSSTNPGTNK